LFAPVNHGSGGALQSALAQHREVFQEATLIAVEAACTIVWDNGESCSIDASGWMLVPPMPGYQVLRTPDVAYHVVRSTEFAKCGGDRWLSASGHHCEDREIEAERRMRAVSGGLSGDEMAGFEQEMSLSAASDACKGRYVGEGCLLQ
jgi:hypothetical protein